MNTVVTASLMMLGIVGGVFAVLTFVIVSVLAATLYSRLFPTLIQRVDGQPFHAVLRMRSEPRLWPVDIDLIAAWVQTKRQTLYHFLVWWCLPWMVLGGAAGVVLNVVMV